MKLIEMLVESGLNGWQWPDGTIAITQDKDKSINQYATAQGLETNKHGTWICSASWQTYLRLSHEEICLASDWATAIITREQYEAALAAKNEGWIEWGGGECPVPRGTLIDVKYLCGDINRHIKAGERDTNGSIGTAFAVRWSKLGAESDIIAYRPHHPQKAEQVRAVAWNAYAGTAKADDEADLNEFIGQDAAPVWSGEGLPPVGCECEFISNDTSWGSVVVIGMDGEVVIKPSGYTYYGIKPSEKQVLRPIRSEAELKREESLRAIYEILDSGTSTKQDAADIYDAIAAGKIPGVKLEGK